MQLVVGDLQFLCFAGEVFLEPRRRSGHSFQIGTSLCTELCITLQQNAVHGYRKY